MAIEIHDYGSSESPVGSSTVVLTQWDERRGLVVTGLGEDDNPVLRFAHPLLTHAIEVEPAASGTTGDLDDEPWFGFNVPKFILEHSGPVFISVFVRPEDVAHKEVAHTKLFVRPRMQPGAEVLT